MHIRVGLASASAIIYNFLKPHFFPSFLTFSIFFQNTNML